MPLSIVRADYHDPRHAADLVNLLDAYASDPMGGDPMGGGGYSPGKAETLSLS